MASGGAWRQPTGEGGEPRARATQPRFSVALVNAVKNELQTGNAMGSATAAREEASPRANLHDAPTQRLADVEGLLSSIEREDEHAMMSAEALVAMGQRAATALVARLPGPLRLDRHTLRGATPPLGEHGPFLAVLQRLGQSAREALLLRLSDPALEVRYYATLALELTAVKRAHPDQNDVQVLSTDDIVFDKLVHTMDATVNAGFPDLSLLDAVPGS